MPKYIKPMINRNKITRECKTCIVTMLFKSDINKWRLSQLDELDKLYNNVVSTRILQRYKIGLIE